MLRDAVLTTVTVSRAAEQHLAYPVLHYFHSTEQDLSAPLALASLNDALLLAGEMTSSEVRPDPSTVSAVTFALEEAEPRRTRLHQLVVSDGWSWSVTGTR